MVVNSVSVTNTTFGKSEVLAVLTATEDAKTVEDTTTLIAAAELSGRVEDSMIELATVAEDAMTELLSVANDTSADVEDRGADTTSEPAGTDAIDDASDAAAEDMVDEHNSEIIPEAPE